MPPSAALAWAARAVGPAGRVRAVSPLGRGIAQATHGLTVDDADGRHRLVLQRWVRPGWAIEDPGFDPAKEATVLHALAGGSVPVPRVVAVDADGSASGAPALLTERLPGRPPTAREVERGESLAVLARTLVEIHRLGMERWTPELARIVPAYYAFGDLAAAMIPPSTRQPDLWREALRIASEPPPAAAGILLHRDYHARNTLWLGDELTGVVDWSSASFGPAAADLAHLRVDLASDFSVEAAVEVRHAYAAAGGDLTDARFHQLRTIFGSLTPDEPDESDDESVARLDRFLEIVLTEPDG